ncbi:MAG: DNA replication and repair protein RecF [Bacteroidetes bacterium]|nr:DNA replication and repair protein RecF [Bacteroidota bacterium]
MPQLTQLSLTQFKNYASSQFFFDKRIVGITGLNGVGKTNFLDAIHFLCLTKSYFTKTDQAAVRHGEIGFRLEGMFERSSFTEKVSCVLRESGKKEISVNGSSIQKQTDHIGNYPLIFIAPDDTLLITGESKVRRAYLDQLIAQLYPDYLRNLITYNKLLQQRNALLKEMAEKKTNHSTVLAAIDQQTIPAGNYLHKARVKTINDLIPQILRLYNKIAEKPGESTEEISIQFNSQLDHFNFEQLLANNQQRDIFLQRTTQGPHRDDIFIGMHGQAFKVIASQGQRKSLLFALKLAALHILEKKNDSPPLLLLDDLFEKLDEVRVQNLIKLVFEQTVSQVFITDTSANRLASNLQKLNLPYQICCL